MYEFFMSFIDVCWVIADIDGSVEIFEKSIPVTLSCSFMLIPKLDCFWFNSNFHDVTSIALLFTPTH